MKKHKKAIIIFVGLIAFSFLLFLLYAGANIANGGIGKTPKDGEIINEKHNICLHTVGNNGSGEWVDIYTYLCDKNVDWKLVFSEGDNLQKHGTLDSISSGECVDIYIKDEGSSESKTLYLKDTFVCTLFGVGNAKKETKYKVNERGKFIELNSQ